MNKKLRLETTVDIQDSFEVTVISSIRCFTSTMYLGVVGLRLMLWSVAE